MVRGDAIAVAKSLSVEESIVGRAVPNRLLDKRHLLLGIDVV
jgi:hypothetical protein